jgi:Secretion system C-terminal sorting domain
MKKLILFAAFIFLANFSKASHHPAGYISYSYLGTPNSYLVKMTLYRDCAGYPFPITDSICVSSVSCGYSFRAMLTDTLPVAISPCYGISSSAFPCAGSSYWIEKHVYSGIVNLPFACNDWELIFNIDTFTLFTSFSLPITLHTSINNLNFPGNSSPSINADPCFEACVANYLCTSINATDANADSLEYLIEDADTSRSAYCPVLYYPASSLTSPFYYFPSAYSALDSSTGLFCFNIPLILSGLVSYRINEYANGNLKSFTKGFFYLSSAGNLTCTTGNYDGTSFYINSIKCNYSDGKLKVFNLLKNDAATTVLIQDLLGRTILERNINRTNNLTTPLEIDFSNSANGMYLCVIKSNETVVGTEKFICK